MKILTICPTYNELNNIDILIKKIFSLKIKTDLLIIDDNSPDGTSDLVKSYMKENNNIFLMSRKRKLGLGTAYCAGFTYALENNYDYVIQMDADLSHNPKDIEKLIDYSKKYDLIIGSRYIKGVNVINWPISRLLLSYCANIYARFITRVPIWDLTGGFKCFNAKVLKSLNLNQIKSEGYSFQIEINFLAYYKGFKLKEIPIIFTDRTIGESKMNKNIVWEAIFMVPKLAIKKIIGNF